MDVKLERERIGYTQAQLASATGIPRDRIAKWEQGKGSPKSEDYIILEKLFREFVPQDSLKLSDIFTENYSKVLPNKLQEPAESYTEEPELSQKNIKQDQANTDSILADLVYSNKILANAMADFAIANKNLSENAVRLTKMAEKGSSSDVPSEIELVAGSIRSTVLELLAELHSGKPKKYNSYGAALAELNKLSREIENRNEGIYTDAAKGR